jgi:hypothetical protein
MVGGMVTATDIEAARQSYFDNADYLESSDVVKARAFSTACRRLLMFQPSRSRAGGANGNEMWIDTQAIKAELDAVTKWLKLNDSGASFGGQAITHSPGGDFRGNCAIGRDYGTDGFSP